MHHGLKLVLLHPVEDCLNRIAVFTLKVVGCCLSNTSKKLNLVYGKQVVDERADPAGELSTTAL